MTEEQLEKPVYEYRTYGTARIFLEAGEYSIADLEIQIELLKRLNTVVSESMKEIK